MFPSSKAEQLIAMGRDRIMEFVTTKLGEVRPSGDLDEAAQKALADAAVSFMQDLVRSAVAVVAAKEFPFIPATLKDAISSLAGRHGQQVLIVLADARVFDESRPPAAIDPDEKELPLDEDPDGDAEPLEDPPVEAAAPTVPGTEKVRAYWAGYDAGEFGEPVTEKPDWVRASKDLAREFDKGWADAKGGHAPKHARPQKPTMPPIPPELVREAAGTA